MVMVMVFTMKNLLDIIFSYPGLTDEHKTEIADSVENYSRDRDRDSDNDSDRVANTLITTIMSDKFLSLAYKFTKLTKELNSNHIVLTRRDFCCGSCGIDFIDEDDAIFYATSSSQCIDSYYDDNPVVSFDVVGTLENHDLNECS